MKIKLQSYTYISQQLDVFVEIIKINNLKMYFFKQF